MDAAPAAGLVRSSATVAVVTGVARALGFARWVVFGFTVGATYLGNTYQTANTVPNVLYDLAAGGMLASVFVPTFVAELESGRERAEEIASALANLFLLVSVPVLIAGAVFAAPIMRVLTAGVADPAVRAAEVELGAWFLRLFLPQIPLYLVGTVLTGLLHAHRRFGLPAAATAFNSVVAISTYVLFRALGPGAELGTVSRTQLWILGAGTTLGVAAQATCTMPLVWRLGLRWRPVLRWRDPALRRALRSGGYGLAFSFVTELGMLVTLALANRVRGGVVAWQVAFAFYEMPNAVTGFPVSVSLLPSLARSAVAGDDQGFADLFSRGMRMASLLLAPAAAGLAVLAAPAASVAFGATASRASPVLVSSALWTMALGLPAYALQQTVVRSLYARQQGRRAVAVNAVSVLVYSCVAATAVLVLQPSSAGTLAAMGAAHAVAQWTGVGAGFVLLSQAVREWRPAGDVGFLASAVGRSVPTAAVVWIVSRKISPAALATAAGVVSGALVYAALAVGPARRVLSRARA